MTTNQTSGVPIGRVVSLHRYPVKSMAGEDLTSAEVTPSGLLGDRAYALVDRDTGRVVSAKRPRKWPGLLDYQVAFEEQPVLDAAIPPVSITPPGGAPLSSTDGEGLDRALSEALGSPVALANVAPEGARLEYHWPDMEGLEYQGRTYRDEIIQHQMLPGTFFDSGIVHLLTTASLDHLGRLMSSGRLDARRFRSNVVVETVEGSNGFVENDWVGRTVRLGEVVRIRVIKPCIRCVMVTMAQGDLPEDPAILKAAFRHNQGNLGVKGSVDGPGLVRVGDIIWLE